MDHIQEEPQEVQSDTATDETTVENESTNPAPDEAVEEQKEEYTPFTPAQQKVFDREISARIGQAKGERDRADRYKQQLKDLETQMPVPEAPVVPDMPDPDDFYGDPEKFNRQMSERDKAVNERAEFVATKNAALRQNEAVQQQQAQAAAVKQNEVLTTYIKNANGLGIDNAQLEREAQIVAGSGLNMDITDHIAGDPKGPLVVNFLASNPLELDKVSHMSPMQASAYIASEIKPKLASTRTVTQAPAPATIVEGAGAPKQEHPFLKGAIID